jgi:uncharacterized protein (TIGR02466 family)
MINDLFTTPIWIAKLNTPEFQLKKIKDDVINLYEKDKDFSPSGWDCNIWTSQPSLDIESKYKLLCENIGEEAMKFVKSLSYNIKTLKSNDFWFNCGDKNTFQEFHRHPYSHISGVYYISVPKDSGNIVFKQNNENMFELPIDKIQNKTKYNTERPKIMPEENKLILFKSDLEHMVEINKSNDLRISMSFNFLVDSDK